MTEPSRNPAVYYVVSCVLAYGSFEEAKRNAPDAIAAHLKRSKDLHEKGTLVMSGVFLDKNNEGLGTMAVLTSRAAAKEYIKGDPFYANGKMSKWSIREWTNMFA